MVKNIYRTQINNTHKTKDQKPINKFYLASWLSSVYVCWGLWFEMCAKNSDFKCGFYFFCFFLVLCSVCFKGFWGCFSVVCVVLFWGFVVSGASGFKFVALNGKKPCHTKSGSIPCLKTCIYKWSAGFFFWSAWLLICGGFGNVCFWSAGRWPFGASSSARWGGLQSAAFCVACWV